MWNTSEQQLSCFCFNSFFFFFLFVLCFVMRNAVISDNCRCQTHPTSHNIFNSIHIHAYCMSCATLIKILFRAEKKPQPPIFVFQYIIWKVGIAKSKYWTSCADFVCQSNRWNENETKYCRKISVSWSPFLLHCQFASLFKYFSVCSSIHLGMNSSELPST